MELSCKMPELPTPGGTSRPVFLIVEENPIIAADIIGMLDACGPCTTLQAEHPHDVLEVVANQPIVDVAILQMTPNDLIDSDAEASLAKSGAEIILTLGEQDEATAQARGWHILARPFTDQMLRDVLEKVRTRQASPDT